MQIFFTWAFIRISDGLVLEIVIIPFPGLLSIGDLPERTEDGHGSDGLDFMMGLTLGARLSSIMGERIWTVWVHLLLYGTHMVMSCHFADRIVKSPKTF